MSTAESAGNEVLRPLPQAGQATADPATATLAETCKAHWHDQILGPQTDLEHYEIDWSIITFEKNAIQAPLPQTVADTATEKPVRAPV